MPITHVVSDPHTLTLTATGEFPVSVQRLWTAWADPRQLERFWGPPGWPATFTAHDLRPGGIATYHMTGPLGETAHGYWRFVKVDAGERIELRDGFAHENGEPNADLPESQMEVQFESTSSGSRFVCKTTFGSLAAMEQLLAMGMQEGLRLALAQIEDVLADLAAMPGTQLERIGEREARVVREVRGSIAQVWRCHHEAALVARWMLGPPGWTMPVCEVATRVGDTYRYEWENAAEGQRFGFTGELLESEAPRRAVTTERMLGTDGPSTHNTLVLSPVAGGRTRIELHIVYPSAELRETILATGMVDGMEHSYTVLDAVLEKLGRG